MGRKTKKHWLSAAEPKFWHPNGMCGRWRVRATRQGQASQWLLDGGRGDGGSTGRAIAWAEWASIKRTILEAERPRERWELDSTEDYIRGELRSEWQAGWDKFLSFELFIKVKDYMSFRLQQDELERQANALVRNEKVTPPIITTSKPFSDLTAIFKAHLDFRLKSTVNGLKSAEDISEARYKQYFYALEHMNKVVGDTECDPSGTFRIVEHQLSSILDAYRTACRAEMVKKSFSGHWFNERMKAGRMLVSFLVANRLATAAPPNISSLTEKYGIEPNPMPIPLPILKAFWKNADSRFQCWMLMALNFGFRQTEIGKLDRKHFRKVGGVNCVEKYRNKTGIPIVIPVWKETEAAMAKHCEKTGPLFLWNSTKSTAPIEAIAYQMNKIRSVVVEAMPEAKDYSFENFRDTGLSCIHSINPMLDALYLGHKNTTHSKFYAGEIRNEKGEAIIPMQMDVVIERLRKYLDLPVPRKARCRK